MKEGETLAVYGLGPIGQMRARIGRHLGARVFGIDPIAERRDMAARQRIEAFAGGEYTADEILDATEGRGPGALVDAVGMEAHGSPVGKFAHDVTGLLPDAIAEPLMQNEGTDRLAALPSSIDLVRRGGTISLSGVHGSTASPMPLLTMFQKQIQLRMGQYNVRSWAGDLLPLVEDSAGPLGLEDFVTHRITLSEAPESFEMFQEKEEGCVKLVLDQTAG